MELSRYNFLVGARRVNMMRAFNFREGFGRDRDKLADKFFTTPLTGGPAHGKCMDREEVENAVIEYYRQRDWDPTTGRPTREALEKLELGWVADLLD